MEQDKQTARGEDQDMEHTGNAVSAMRRRLELAIKNRGVPKTATNPAAVVDSYSEKLLPSIRNKLEKVLDDRGITNYTIQVESASNPGDNFLGFIGKITITGTNKSDEEITFNWILKIAPPLGHPHRKVLRYELVYAREVYMYEKVFQIFEEFQMVKSIQDPFNNRPEFIFSYLEPSNECLCMESIKTQGYVLRKRQEPLDYNHVKLALRTYGKFHAISFAMKDQNREEFETLVRDMKDVFTVAQDPSKIAMTQKPFMENALKLLDEYGDGALIDKFRKFVEGFAGIFKDAVNTINEYSVITHGDCWVNNLLWKYDLNSNNPIDVCLLDFQLARYGSPVCDLSHFIFTATEKSLRDSHYDEMIKLYYESLCDHLIKLGGDPSKLFPFSALEIELKRFSMVGLYWSVMVLKVMIRDEHLDKKSNDDLYRQRMRDIIIDYYEKGYFDFL